MNDRASILPTPQIAHSLGIEFAPSLADFPTSSDFIAAVPIAFARTYQLLGLVRNSADRTELLLVLGDLKHWEQLQIIARLLGRTVTPLLAPPEIVTAAINAAYQARTGQAQEFIDTLDRNQVLDEVQRLGTREDLLDNAARAPVIKLVNLLLFEAVKANASDVHVQPYEERLMVRMRVDGVLFDAYTLPKNVQEEVISRIKVMGRMNIAEKRLPQDGRATVQIGDRSIDLRIASLPTSFGERVVVRLLDKSARLFALPELGMDPATLKKFAQLISIEHGLILVTGPTGSGKSTTLYSALNRINSKEKNVITLEDPIEYQLEGISQTQVNAKKGMTFASGLRNVLRQDPDVIMVGEIRDLETATMAIQSSLTGHLVFSTLHTNDAPAAITRLFNIGIEPYLVSASVAGVMAQRLVRKLCQACKEAYEPTINERRQIEKVAGPVEKLFRAKGCPRCRNLGYTGRIGIYELFVPDDEAQDKISSGASLNDLRDLAKTLGMKPLRVDGVEKVKAGITTLEEVYRVTA